MDTKTLRAAIKAINPENTVSGYGECWTVKTANDLDAVRACVEALGLTVVGMETVGSQWDWTYVLSVTV